MKICNNMLLYKQFDNMFFGVICMEPILLLLSTVFCLICCGICLKIRWDNKILDEKRKKACKSSNPLPSGHITTPVPKNQKTLNPLPLFKPTSGGKPPTTPLDFSNNGAQPNIPANTRNYNYTVHIVPNGSKVYTRKMTLGDIILIGSAENNHVILEDATVESFHAALIVKEDGLYLRNDAVYGQTFIEENQIDGEMPVHNEQTAKFGSTRVTFCIAKP